MADLKEDSLKEALPVVRIVWFYIPFPTEFISCFEKWGLLGAEGVCLSKKEKNTLGYRLARLVKRALNSRCQEMGTSAHSTPTSLMSVSAGDPRTWSGITDQEENAWKSTEEFLTLQPVNWLHWGPNLNAFVQTHRTRQWTSDGCVPACRAITLLPSLTREGMSPWMEGWNGRYRFLREHRK